MESDIGPMWRENIPNGKISSRVFLDINPYIR